MTIKKYITFITPEQIEKYTQKSTWSLFYTTHDGDMGIYLGEFNTLDEAKEKKEEQDSTYHEPSPYPHYCVGKKEITTI